MAEKEENKDQPKEKMNENSASVDDFKSAFGEDFSNTIDLDTWRIGENLAELYPFIESELQKAKQDEEKNHEIFRTKVFPRIEERKLVQDAGLHKIDNEEIIQRAHRGLLFNGGVTACGSVSAVYDTIPISITQIGVCLVNYHGQHGSYSHRLFRRDLRFKGDDPVKEAINLLERRGSENGDKGKKLSDLAVRGIKAYAERAILFEKSDSKWILGSGSPTPYELMTGFWASKREMKDKSIGLMNRMVQDHKRFVYVQSSTRSPQLWTFGNALQPFEYLVIDTMEDPLTKMVEDGGTRGDFRKSYETFAKETGSKIARGIYKVSNQAPPHIFYCHVDHIHTAAIIAMADSVLQMHQGSPMLLNLADTLCQSSFGKNDFIATIQQAYHKANTLITA